jgi:hypothetical protein
MENSLAKIQAAVKAPKGQYNSFGKYRYRSCEYIVEAVKPVINPLGFYLTLSDEVTEVGGRVYVKATATLSNGQETYIATASAREEETKKGMDGSQITGAASSYARKYALNGLFAIDDTKDADSTNTHNDEIQETDEVGEQNRAYLQSLLETSAFDDDTKRKMSLRISQIIDTVSFDKAKINLIGNQIEDKDRIAMGMPYNQSDIKKTQKARA